MGIVEGFKLSMKILERSPSGEGAVAEVSPFIHTGTHLTWRTVHREKHCDGDEFTDVNLYDGFLLRFPLDSMSWLYC
jgi:hypothetical protein